MPQLLALARRWGGIRNTRIPSDALGCDGVKGALSPPSLLLLNWRIGEGRFRATPSPEIRAFLRTPVYHANSLMLSDLAPFRKFWYARYIFN